MMADNSIISNQMDITYHGPPPPPPNYQRNRGPQLMHQNKMQMQNGIGDDKQTAATSTHELWASPATDTAKIVTLDVKCEKDKMKIFLQFDKPFQGIVFSKGHYNNINCVHLPAGVRRTSVTFDIGIHACGTLGNSKNGLYDYVAGSGTGTYFENIIIIQYDAEVQEVWDQARKLRCTWHDQYEKNISFKPFPVDTLDVIPADFAGDNVGCWMQIQVGKGPWASEVSGLVKIGQTMTMVLAIKDIDTKFDMLVRNCVAHDGKRTPIQLIDQRGCIVRPKLFSPITKIKNFGASASVLSYAHFQAFKFPDSLEVHFQCTIQICRYQCPNQCADSSTAATNPLVLSPDQQLRSLPLSPPHRIDEYGNMRNEKRIRRTRAVSNEIGIDRVIKVVSSGDVTFKIANENNKTDETTMIFTGHDDSMVCMTTPGFTIASIVLFIALLASYMLSFILYIRLRPFARGSIFCTRNDQCHNVCELRDTTFQSANLALEAIRNQFDASEFQAK